MKAILVRAYGGPEVIRLDDVPTPEAGPGEVLVRVCAVGVNRARDLMVCGGRPDCPDALPLVPGQDPAGEVAAVGDGVANLGVGDRVVVNSRISCGACAACAAGDTSDCRRVTNIGIHRWGGYADYVAVPAGRAFPIGDRLSFAEAAVVMRHYPMAFQLLDRKAGLKPGEWVLVMGAAGGLGSCGVQAAKHMGATVIAAAGSDDRVAMGAALGADHGINYRTEDLTARVMEITGGRGVEVVFENISDPTTWPTAFASLAFRGRMVTAGAHGGPKVEVDMRHLYHNRLRIIGAAGSDDRDAVRALQAAHDGHVTAVIDRTLPLSALHEAFDLIGSGKVGGKIVLDPTLGGL